MATPMTADEFLAALHKWGVRYVQHDGPSSKSVGTGWRSHNRNGGGRQWGPVNGVVIHHTGSADQGIALLWDGKPGVPGPLVQVSCDVDGVLHLIGWGRANHAGGGDPRVLAAVAQETYVDRPPATHEHEGSSGSVDGNTHFYGIENQYTGGAPMTPPQYATAVRYAAAVCDHHGWSAKSAIGHKEWSDWKPDPGHVDMVTFRRDVAAQLAAGPPGTVTPAHKPVTPTRPPTKPPTTRPTQEDPVIYFAPKGSADEGAEVLSLDATGVYRAVSTTAWRDLVAHSKPKPALFLLERAQWDARHAEARA